MKKTLTFLGGLMFLIATGSCEVDKIGTSETDLFGTADLKVGALLQKYLKLTFILIGLTTRL